MMSTDVDCDGCGEVFADEDDLELHPCPANPANREALTILSVTFPGCEHTVSLMAGNTLPSVCPACATGIPAGETRCEDFPCCGHGQEGCMPRPEFTKDYWLTVMSADGWEWPDYDD